MAAHGATIHWRRDEHTFVDGRYSRAHIWQFDGGATIAASSSPHVVPLPWSDAGAVDPEETFVASLSSCHMLWFLAIAAKRGFVVDEYVDRAEGRLERNAAGRLAVTQVILRPQTVFAGDVRPTAEEIAAMHHRAHEECFIANSVTTQITCLPA